MRGVLSEGHVFVIGGIVEDEFGTEDLGYEVGGSESGPSGSGIASSSVVQRSRSWSKQLS